MAEPAVKERPGLKTAPPVEAPPRPREIRLRPPERPKRFVRWIEYAAVLIIVGTAAAIAVIMTAEDEATPLDVDAASEAVLGERLTNPDFAVEPRWVGESDMTLEEFEATYESFNQRYEAGSGLVPLAAPQRFETLYRTQSGLVFGVRQGDPDFAVQIRFLGESDMTLEEFEAQFDTFETLYEAGSGPVLPAQRFETLYRTQSGLVFGVRQGDPDFTVQIRFLGESDMTLEELELYSR